MHGTMNIQIYIYIGGVLFLIVDLFFIKFRILFTSSHLTEFSAALYDSRFEY